MIGLIARRTSPTAMRAADDHSRQAVSGPMMSTRTFVSPRTVSLTAGEGHELVGRHGAQPRSGAVLPQVRDDVVAPRHASVSSETNAVPLALELDVGAGMQAQLLANRDRDRDLTLGADAHGPSYSYR